MEQETAVRRGRPPMNREDAVDLKSISPRERAASELERAAARVKALREGGWDAADSSSGIDEFYISPDLPGEGWGYEWKTMQVMGMDHSSHIMALRKAGWEEVRTDRHPELMPLGTPGHVQITRKGNGLFERPLELTEESRRVQQRDAREQVRQKEAGLNDSPAGQFERSNKDAPLAKIKRSYEAMPIPE